jgi:branched-subunit amino acid aminotransferase/4-amino-4-deoxychorismate lyase
MDDVEPVPGLPRVELDGRPPTAERLRALALDGYGHFTAAQVRGHRTRGLALHLARLADGNRALFGAGLDAELVRAHVRHALGQDTPDASVRVIIQRPEADPEPSVTVLVRPPGGMGGGEWRLVSVPYQRSLAHLKHLGDFGQSYYGRQARAAGYDEALLTGPDGVISEGAITNIGFFDGDAIVWPAAAVLPGITMQLLQAGLAELGVPMRWAPVRLADLGSFTGAFVTNSRGIAAVARVDGEDLPVDHAAMRRLTELYDAVPWDEL